MNDKVLFPTMRRGEVRWFVALMISTLAATVFFYVISIKLVVAALLLAGLVAIMLARPEFTTLAVMFTLYANLAAVAIQSFQVPPPLAIGFFLLLGIPLAHHVVFRRRPIIVDRTLLLMLAYLAVLLISASFSRDPSQSADKLGQYMAEGVVLYFLVLNTIRTPSLLRKVLWTLVLAGAFMGSISLYQRVTLSYDNSFGGMSQIDNGTAVSPGDEEDDVGQPRAAGPIGEKNRFAQVMIVLLPFAIVLFRSESSRKLRLQAGLCGGLVLAGVLLTYSRGAAIALVLLFAALVMLKYVRPAQALGYGMVALLMVVLVAPGFTGRLAALASVSDIDVGSRGQTDSSLRGRAAEMLAALHIFLDHPLLGVGPGQTRLYTAEYGNQFGMKRLEGTRRGHNLYLEELADSGVVGFSVLMVILGLTLRRLAQARRHWLASSPAQAELATGLLLSLGVYLATAMFLHLSYQRYFWLLIALAGTAVHLSRSGTAPAPVERPK